MDPERAGNFPPGGKRFYMIKLEPEALTCCTLEEFQRFSKGDRSNGGSTRAFCEMADTNVCAKMAKDGLCARNAIAQAKLPSVLSRAV